MATDSKTAPAAPTREKGVRIFTYPKIIFIFPSLLMAGICWVGMLVIGDKVDAPSHVTEAGQVNAAPGEVTGATRTRDFRSPQNMFAVLFLGVFALNLLIMAMDFPRFTIIAGLLLGTTVLFLLLWLGAFFDLLRPLIALASGIYIVANSQFYLAMTILLSLVYVVIMLTRWLDYWEILPNEILHHHGPLSDLERYPTMNLKFDKEIPDVLEHFMFGAGRLVLHVANERKSIVLDNVLQINKKEDALKKLMSRLEVRITTDQEIGQP